HEAASALSTVGVAIGSAFGALAAQAIGSMAQRFIELTQEVVKTGMAMESLKMSYSAIFGGDVQGALQMEYVSQTADRLGQSFVGLAESYRLYSAAAKGTTMSSESLKDGFEAITSASTALGLSTERTELIFKAFTQIMSKGQVMMEEVKNQLGDSLPGALDLFAKSMGVSKKEFMDMAKEGKLLSDDVLPKVFIAMKQMYEQAAETAALETGRAAVNRLTSEWDKLKSALFDTLPFTTAVNSIRALIQGIREAIEEKTGLAKLAEQQSEINALIAQRSELEQQYGMSAMRTNAWQRVDGKIKELQKEANLLRGVIDASKIQDSWLVYEQGKTKADSSA
ncbi:MAG: hypothetical protein EOL91_13775, partial [Actinobacteria bacterium]|nr:hypothetical protein [Actinomycetota bacterium]